MEISEVRKRYRLAIEQARKASAERRARADQASRAYAVFLSEVATPMFRMVATVLKAEGHAFNVFTPADGLRLMSERSADDYIELVLDASTDPPAPLVRVNRGRGRRVITDERPLAEGVPIEGLTEENVLEMLLREIVLFVER